MADPRKLFIKTYGCQMNVYDSERMAEAMGGAGYVETSTPEDADMILLNTCHIREKAAEKVYSELGRLKELKAAKPDLRIGVAGCVAQAEGEEIMRRQPLVDLVVGPQSYHRLPEMEARTSNGAKVVDTDFPEEDKFEKLKKRPQAKRGPTAFLTVQEGCDKFCAFCVVPYTRGAEVSRPVSQVLTEARDLVERGVREITLLGQNVNAYHGAHEGGDWTLATLIRELAKGRAAELIAGLDAGRPASVRGRLYALESAADGGWYPILLPDSDRGIVRGILHDARSVDWPAMDDFEDAHDGPDAEYVRREIAVTLADGASATAFVYCYARSIPADAEPIPGGDFAAWLSQTGRVAIGGRE